MSEEKVQEQNKGKGWPKKQAALLQHDHGRTKLEQAPRYEIYYIKICRPNQEQLHQELQAATTHTCFAAAATPSVPGAWMAPRRRRR
jgi:hypothetical protein